MPFKSLEDKKKYMTAYYKRHGDKIRQQSRDYHQSNKEHRNSQRISWRLANNERHKSTTRRCRQDDLQAYQARSRVASLVARLEAICHYSNGLMCCNICQESRLTTLTIDHINGGGNQHRKSLKLPGGGIFSQWLRRNQYPIGYRVLCSNCNWSEHCKISPKKCSIEKSGIMNILGGQCVGCKTNNLTVLTVHHVNNNGAEHRRQISNGKGGPSFYKAILRNNDFSGLECRCYSCNDALAWERKPEDVAAAIEIFESRKNQEK